MVCNFWKNNLFFCQTRKAIVHPHALLVPEQTSYSEVSSFYAANKSRKKSCLPLIYNTSSVQVFPLLEGCSTFCVFMFKLDCGHKGLLQHKMNANTHNIYIQSWYATAITQM